MAAMPDPGGARRSFLAAQLAVLEPLDFLVIGIAQPPFDSVAVRLPVDGAPSVLVSPRGPGAPPFSSRQEQALAALGFRTGDGGWELASPPGDTEAVAGVVERVLTDVLDVPGGARVDLRHGSTRAEYEAAQRLESMKAQVEPVIRQLTGGDPVVDGDGDYIVDVGESRVFVAPRAAAGRPSVIRVFAITNAGVALGPELGMFLGRLNFGLMFGRFSIDVDNQAVWLDETLLGDHITDDELRFTIEAVASTAQEWEHKIAASFGGRVRQPPTPEDASPRLKPGQGGYL